MKAEISKEKFVEIIHQMETLSRITDEIYKLFKESGNGYLWDAQNGSEVILAEHEIVIDLLAMLLHDKEGHISYFIYEQDYGRDAEVEVFNNEKGSYDPVTAENLYDFLAERMENEDGNER